MKPKAGEPVNGSMNFNGIFVQIVICLTDTVKYASSWVVVTEKFMFRMFELKPCSTRLLQRLLVFSIHVSLHHCPGPAG